MDSGDAVFMPWIICLIKGLYLQYPSTASGIQYVLGIYKGIKSKKLGEPVLHGLSYPFVTQLRWLFSWPNLGFLRYVSEPRLSCK